jgi:23S rRNA-/tRNA-specific pseudouridylate synthase
MEPLVTTLWEDRDLLAVEKPAGLLVDSGGRGRDLISVVGGGVFAFHRLDRDTSGIVLLGKTRRYAREVTALFEEKRIRKAYMVVVRGTFSVSRVETPIEDRAALTTFRRFALGTYKGEAASWIEALPKTGRTHQIRIHCASVGHAILGDARYGGVSGSEAMVGVRDALPAGHALHSYRLDFRHPANGEAVSVRSAPLKWPWLEELETSAVWPKHFGAPAGDADGS